MKHQISISGNSGYCMGVKKAFLESYEIASKNENSVLYGEMVHNRFALKALTDAGIRIIDDLQEILNDKEIQNVIIRAHGIPSSEEKMLIDSGKKIYDLTCPKVKQVQLLAGKLTDDGYKIVIFGKKHHPEVTGIKGYCNTSNLFILNKPELVDEVPFYRDDDVALISQTTMNSSEFEKIAGLLKSRYAKLEVHNTLCASPVKTQVEAEKLARKTGIMIIVGDKMSANNNTLYEKVSSITQSVFVETADELDLDRLKNYEKIGIAGGSSTPDRQIKEIKDRISGELNR